MENIIVWATLISPIIGVSAIIVALYVARSSSKDAREQIKSIRTLLDVFVAVNNLNIVEAQRTYHQQLKGLDRLIEEAQLKVEIVSPFIGGARLEQIQETQKKESTNRSPESAIVKTKGN